MEQEFGHEMETEIITGLQVRLLPYVKMDDGCSVPSTMTPGFPPASVRVLRMPISDSHNRRHRHSCFLPKPQENAGGSSSDVNS